MGNKLYFPQRHLRSRGTGTRGEAVLHGAFRILALLPLRYILLDTLVSAELMATPGFSTTLFALAGSLVVALPGGLGGSQSLDVSLLPGKSSSRPAPASLSNDHPKGAELLLRVTITQAIDSDYRARRPKA